MSVFQDAFVVSWEINAHPYISSYAIGRLPATIWPKSIFSSNTITMSNVCRHPKVRIVSRHGDSEFVECLECGEVFDSEEFRDMEIENTAETQQDEEES